MKTLSDTNMSDTLLDLHAKLSTVVRYYDRMLEDRLSKAYSQHSIGGYNLPVAREGPNPYPSLQQNPLPANLGGGGAESFYTGEQPPSYRRESLHQPYGQPPQATQQMPYAGYDKRTSVVGPPSGQYPPQQQQQQQLQRTGSWGPQAPPIQSPQYTGQPSQPPIEQMHPGNHLQQAAPQTPQPTDQVGATPTSDPNASFYFNTQSPPPAQQQPSAPGPDPNLPYPNLSQPMQSYQPSLPQTPASVTAQPAQNHQPQQPSQQQAHQPYWQHPAAQQTALPPVWQAQPNAQYSGYNQESFPAAPHHAPKQPVVEESLIDL